MGNERAWGEREPMLPERPDIPAFPSINLVCFPRSLVILNLHPGDAAPSHFPNRDSPLSLASLWKAIKPKSFVFDSFGTNEQRLRKHEKYCTNDRSDR